MKGCWFPILVHAMQKKQKNKAKGSVHETIVYHLDKSFCKDLNLIYFSFSKHLSCQNIWWSKRHWIPGMNLFFNYLILYCLFHRTKFSSINLSCLARNKLNTKNDNVKNSDRSQNAASCNRDISGRRLLIKMQQTSNEWMTWPAAIALLTLPFSIYSANNLLL